MVRDGVLLVYVACDPATEVLYTYPGRGRPDLNCLKDQRVTLMTFPEGVEELTQDSWRTEHHDLA